MSAESAGERVPISLVTGFLGSGKTTLIAALLRQPAMAGTAVVVNEFGEVGIDDAIFAQSVESSDVVLLANGCLCCTAGDDLAATVWGLTRRTDRRPTRIVIETSGLADPVPTLQRLMGDPRLRQETKLDAVVATVDALAGLANLDTRPVAARQAAVADRRIITKPDLAGPDAVAALKARLLALNAGAPVLEVASGAIDAGDLFGAGLIDPLTERADVDRWMALDRFRAMPSLAGNRSIHFSGGPADGGAIGAWLVEEARPVDWEALSPRLGEIIARHGDRLLRLKGVVHTAGDPRPLVIHGVQRLFHRPVRVERWTRPPATSIVAIGDPGAAEAIALIAEALRASAVDATGSGDPTPSRLTAAA